MKLLIKLKKFVCAVTLPVIILIAYHIYSLPTAYVLGEAVSFRSCPPHIADATLVDWGGFLTANERWKGQAGVAGLYDFVLKPNSTGHIMMSYDFGEYTTDDVMRRYHTTLSDTFGTIKDLWKLDGAGLVYLPADKADIMVYTSSTVNMTDHAIVVTYTVKANASAEKGTYLISLFQTCPGELVTVGEQPYEGPLPWDPKFLPPLSQSTISGKFRVDISWSPVTLEPSKLITIYVMIRDEHQNVIRDAGYDFVISDAGGKVLLDERNVKTTLGQGIHEVTFESSGTAHIIVTYRGSLDRVESGIADKAEFNLIVVPEFPLGVVVTIATIVAIMIVATKFNVVIQRTPKRTL